MSQRLTEQQAKEIIYESQLAAYPNKNVPQILAPLYEYIEQTEGELKQAQKALAAACAFIVKTSCLSRPVWENDGTWEEYFCRIAREEERQ